MNGAAYANVAKGDVCGFEDTSCVIDCRRKELDEYKKRSRIVSGISFDKRLIAVGYNSEKSEKCWCLVELYFSLWPFTVLFAVA